MITTNTELLTAGLSYVGGIFKQFILAPFELIHKDKEIELYKIDKGNEDRKDARKMQSKVINSSRKYISLLVISLILGGSLLVSFFHIPIIVTKDFHPGFFDYIFGYYNTSFKTFNGFLLSDQIILLVTMIIFFYMGQSSGKR